MLHSVLGQRGSGTCYDLSASVLRQHQASSKAHSRTCPKHSRIWNGPVARVIRHIAAGLPEVLEIWLQRPARRQAVWCSRSQAAPRNCAPQKRRSRRRRSGPVGDAGIGDTNGKRVVRAPRDHAREGNAAIGIKIDEVPVGRCTNDAAEQRHALGIFAPRAAASAPPSAAARRHLPAISIGGIFGLLIIFSPQLVCIIIASFCPGLVIL